jgi:hypothetical protein
MESLEPEIAVKALYDNAVALYRPQRVAAGAAERSG